MIKNDILEKVIINRPKALRKYDQIYMYSSDMYNQALEVARDLENKDVVFLGDGDGMNVLFLLLMEQEIISAAKGITVLDFDERIVHSYERVYSKIESGIKMQAKLYNVICPISAEDRRQYDYFYINPPYGSKNGGKSCIAWLYRCMELCKENSKGCIILPYDVSEQWTVQNMNNIQNFLLESGYVIVSMGVGRHRYYLDDNPKLRSGYIIVERTRGVKNPYEGDYLGEDLLSNFYGNKRKIPIYIRDNNTAEGIEDFSWKYGQKEY